MNKNVAYGTFFATGLALGGGGGYFLAKKKFRLLAEEEVASVRDAFHELNRISREAAGSKNDESSDPEGTPSQPAMGLSKQPRTQAADREFVEYNKVVAAEQYVGSQSESETPSDSEVDPRIVEEKPVKAVEIEVNDRNNVDVRVTYEQAESVLMGGSDSSGPHLIDVGEFMTNESDYDQITMTWYAGDNTLIFDDQPDEMVDDLSIVGGLTALTSFGVDSMNEYTIYVRDDDNQKMYEIVRDTRRFSAGIDT